MSKRQEQPTKRPAGRPAAEKPKRTQISFRVDDDVLGALGKYQASLNVTELPLADAVRDLIVKSLKREGLL